MRGRLWGQTGFERQESETASKVFRRSIYFVRDLPAGAMIGPEDIRRIRPGNGLVPKHFDELVGQRLTRAVIRGTAASWDILAD